MLIIIKRIFLSDFQPAAIDGIDVMTRYSDIRMSDEYHGKQITKNRITLGTYLLYYYVCSA